VFRRPGMVRRNVFLGPLIVVAAAMAWALHADRSIHDIKEAVALFSAGLFVAACFFTASSRT
jgi:4-hydroxybenzoate polyprenyltransferase